MYQTKNNNSESIWHSNILIMKTTIFSAVMMFTALSLNANQPLKEVKNTHSAAASEAPDNDGIQANALYKFKGTIGLGTKSNTRRTTHLHVRQNR